YVRGVAVIGSVGRGTQWPLSDVDLMVVTDLPEDENPQRAIHEEQVKRIKRLEEARNPVTVEADLWAAFRLKDIEAAVEESDEEFLSRLEHWRWQGTLIKAQGAKVYKDHGRYLSRFIERCNRMFRTEAFTALWLRSELDSAKEKVSLSQDTIEAANYPEAALHLLSATHHGMMGGCYAMWSKIPQSLTRCITRFENAARDAGGLWALQSILELGRLGEEDAWKRFLALPEECRKTTEIVFQMRRQTGEDVSMLDVVRDNLHASAHHDTHSAQANFTHGWESLSHTSEGVQIQLEKAAELVNCFQEHLEGLSTVSEKLSG
ncbi:nucleotidyltransferase domain-containing protein, partial [Candidatus Hydrogenedentota bacterium]